jgi:enoyl-CoA hydratase
LPDLRFDHQTTWRLIQVGMPVKLASTNLINKYMAITMINHWFEENIAVIQLDRERANAITYEMACKLDSVIEEIISNNPGAIVVTGRGTFFTGGLDLKVVPTYSSEQQSAFLSVINRVISRFYSCSIPVIGAINGHAIAAGFMFTLTTDYRIGPMDNALFGLTEIRAGIPFPAAPMEILKAELAPSDIRFTTLAAKNYGPEEALRRGVLDELVPNEQVFERSLEVARDFSSMPADAYRRVKQQIRGSTIEILNQLNQQESDPMLSTWLDPDANAASKEILNGH